MERLLTSLTICAFLLVPLPAMAQSTSDAPAKAQEADMPRKVRVLVQRGLAALGFDPGPADGLFSRKTRAAIWNWQKAKELETTGYLTRVEAEALAAVGAEASEKSGREAGPSKRRRGGREARTEPAPSRRRNRILYTPRCGAEKEPGGCWRELSSPANCNVWIAPYYPKGVYARGKTVIWSGECARQRSVLDGLAHGRGTLKAGDWSYTGEYVDGKRRGQWVERDSEGYVQEGPYVDGKRHGRWLERSSGKYSGVAEGPFVDGKRHGQWVIRLSNGTVIKVPYVDGRQHGRRVSRHASGTVFEYPYVNGKLHGRAVTRFSDGTVWEGPYVDGKRHGRWIWRYPDGRSKVEEYRNGKEVTP